MTQYAWMTAYTIRKYEEEEILFYFRARKRKDLTRMRHCLRVPQESEKKTGLDL